MTRGLSLRTAIDYGLSALRFFPGFEALIEALHRRRKQFVINSTGYTVTTEVIKRRFGPEKFFRVICNQLVFGWKGDPQRSLSNGELTRLIGDYMAGRTKDTVYDDIRATGEVLLGISDEAKKPLELFRLAELLEIPRSAIAHIGDTMGDSAGIVEVARNGGLGVAFNYNEQLRDYLQRIHKTEKLSGRIVLVDPKGNNPDLRNLLPLLLPEETNDNTSLHEPAINQRTFP